MCFDIPHDIVVAAVKPFQWLVAFILVLTVSMVMMDSSALTPGGVSTLSSL